MPVSADPALNAGACAHHGVNWLRTEKYRSEKDG